MKTSITFYSAVLSLLTGFAAQAQGVIHPATNSYNDGPSQFSAFPATPPAYNAAAKVNFVRSWIPRKPITNVADVNTQADRYIDQATNYVDGLGRPLQAV
ncbi:MAG TPA: hypothetical protein PKK69_10315, partial [Ferruginibacter sp.]|nr:hypothetical protein [Ferruginibacter sp.]